MEGTQRASLSLSILSLPLFFPTYNGNFLSLPLLMGQVGGRLLAVLMMCPTVMLRSQRFFYKESF